MTIEQCYQEMGGNYAEVYGRLHSQKLVEKFARKFLDDPSYAELTAAMASGDHDAAFRAAHTLKGVAANLGFTKLLSSVSGLTELLRTPADSIPAEAAPMVEAITRDYEATAAAIHALD